MRPVLVGLDVGTTRVKAIAVAADGSVLAESAVATPWVHDGPQAEMAPEHLAQVLRAVLDGVVRHPGWPEGGRAIGIGIASMAEAGILMDGSGTPLAPIIAWHDPRGDVETLRSAVGIDAFESHVGMRLNSKPSVTKLLWLQGNSDVGSAATYLSVAEWVAYLLGADPASELCLVSRTGLFDVVARAPWKATLDLVGDLLPGPVVTAGDAVGRVGDEWPEPMRGAVITIAGMDHHAGAFASGAATSQALFDSMGTAEALLRFTPGPLTHDDLRALAVDDIAVMWSVIPDHVCLLAAFLTGLSLERIAKTIGATDRDQRLRIASEALTTERGSLSLEDTAHDGLSIRGIDDSARPAALWRASVEDLLALSEASVHRMTEIVGPPSSIVIAGGWIKDPMVAATKRASLGEFRVSDVDEAGAMGAAMFAAIAAGVMQRPSASETPRWS